MDEPTPCRSVSAAWFPVAVAAVVVPVLWVVLGYTEDGHPAMPAWAALLHHFVGREAVVGVFAVAGYVWLCVAVSETHPNLAATLLLGAVIGALVALGVAGVGGPSVTAFAGWAVALIGSQLLPGARVRRVTFAVTWFGGATAGAVVAALAGRWCGASFAASALALGVWVAAARPPTPEKP